MTSHGKPQGFSLISLLVGLVVSMIVILGSMALFNSTLQSNTRASQDARITGERATGLLVAHMELQGAGFGIPSAQPENHLRLISGAALTANQGSNTAKVSGGANQTIGTNGTYTGNALIWSQEVNGQNTCTGLFAPSKASIDASSEMLPPSLYLLRSQNCSSTTEDLNWVPHALVAENPTLRNARAFSFIIRHEPCQGLGIAGEGYLEATISTRHSTGSTQADNESVDLATTTCLLNFPQ